MTDFVDWLAGLSPDDLTLVLGNRRDVLEGVAPDDLGAVASRLGHPRSLATALVAQPKPSLQVLTALAVLGGDAPVSRIAAFLEPGHDPTQHVEQVRHWSGVLEASALVWLDGDEVHGAPGAAGVLAIPEQLGAPTALLLEQISRDRLRPTLRAWGLPADGSKAAMVTSLTDALADPVAVRERLGRLTDQERQALVDELTEDATDFDLARYQKRHDVLGRAVAAGLSAGVLLPGYTAYACIVPAEVRIALRGNGIAFDPDEPRRPTGAASPQMVERESRAALQQFAEAAITVMDHVRDRPLKWVRNGGIGAREVTRVAKACRVEVPMVRLVLDLAYAAGLFEWTDAGFACGQVAREWRDLDDGVRTVSLIQQWPFLGWTPTQTHDPAGKSLAVGDRDRQCDRCTDARMSTMAEWLRVEPDQGVSDEAMAELMAWLRPLDHFAHRAHVVEEETYGYRRRGASTVKKTYPEPLWLVDVPPTLGGIADEARMLGLVAHGAATPVLRALFGQGEAGQGEVGPGGGPGGLGQLVELLSSMLPKASGRATFGSDLTAVVTGPPTGELSALLDSCADREGRGGAATWRFSTSSVRRAFDAGSTAAQLELRLSAVASGALPQPLTYLIGDVGRRHGAVRVLDARAVLRCEDVGLLAEVVADRKLRRLGLVQVAPTVAVSGAGSPEVLEALRKAGYLPMPWLDPQGDPGSAGSAGSAGSTGSGTAAGAGDPDGAGDSDSADPLDDELAALLASQSAVIDLDERRSQRDSGSSTREQVEAAAHAARARTPETPEEAGARLVGLPRAERPVAPVEADLLGVLRRGNRQLSEDELQTLARAIHDGGPVRILYRSASGSITDRVISQLVFSGHLIDAWCHLRNDSRMFLVGEIQSVTRAPD